MLAVEVARYLFDSLWQRLVTFPTLFGGGPGSGGPPEALNFLSTLIAFAISPCILFVLLYRLGRGVRLEDEGASAAVSLFAGGALAGVLFLVMGGIDYQQGFISYLAALGPDLANGWYLGSLILSVLGTGLFDLFVGMTAIVFATYRLWRSQGGPEKDEPGPGAEGPATP